MSKFDSIAYSSFLENKHGFINQQQRNIPITFQPPKPKETLEEKKDLNIDEIYQPNILDETVVNNPFNLVSTTDVKQAFNINSFLKKDFV
jgi:hypothetical protein